LIPIACHGIDGAEVRVLEERMAGGLDLARQPSSPRHHVSSQSSRHLGVTKQLAVFAGMNKMAIDSQSKPPSSSEKAAGENGKKSSYLGE